MLNNYFKVAIRNILRFKWYSFINIVGLAVGMACCILIMLWVIDELSYDDFHENGKYIYRVVQENSGVTSPPFAATLKEELPEIIEATRFRDRGKVLAKYKTKSFARDKLSLTDPSFFDIFSFPLVKGDPAVALSDPRSILLTEEACKKYFSDKDPIGETITIDGKFEFHVTGVLGNIPRPSNFDFDMLANFTFLKDLWVEDLNDWEDFSYYNFVLTRKNIDLNNVNRKINEIYDRHSPDNIRSLHLQPLADIYLHNVSGEGGPIVTVYIFSAIALIVLLIACLNFINLTTARGIKRAREIGVRKTVGAYRSSLVLQFILESVLMAILAVIISIICVEVFLPTFNSITGKNLYINPVGNLFFWGSIAGITLFTGLLAGIYPALYFSSINPAKALKVSLLKGTKTRTPLRKILVVCQLSLSIILILFTFSIHRQLAFVKTAELGYLKDNIIYLTTTSDEVMKIAPGFEELMKNPGIKSATITGNLPGLMESSSTKVNWEGKNPGEQVRMEIIYAGYDFHETFGLEMAEGRFYSYEFPSDLESGYVVNESAVKAMSLTNKSAIGASFSLYDKKGIIVGILKDFHSRSFHHEIAPLIVKLSPYPNDHLCFRLHPENTAATLKFMKDVWQKYAPDYPFDYSYFGETIDGLYGTEQRMINIFSSFAFLAIFISCLGLFGLASFITEQRTKEIGIRKIFGAPVFHIIGLLSKEFLVLTVLAVFISWPIGYFAIDRWLQNFAYHTNVEGKIFFMAGAMALLITIAAVSYQAIKAARTNPAETLNYE
jgi:putative ABC transport system permease protein